MKIVTRDMPENPYWKKYLVLDHPLLTGKSYQRLWDIYSAFISSILQHTWDQKLSNEA